MHWPLGAIEHMYMLLEVHRLACGTAVPFLCICGEFNPGEERRLNNLSWSWAAGVLSSAQSETHEGQDNMML